MPHFVIEYARPMEAELSISDVMQIAFDAGSNSGLMNPDDIKVRAIPFDHFRFEGGVTSFLHVTVSMLAGRTPEQKEHLAILVRRGLADAFASVESISVDVRDMDPTAYKKRLLPASSG